MNLSSVVKSAATATFAASALLLSVQPAAAQMSSRPGLTFGGTGIDNSAVVTNDSASLGVLLGLTATPRCKNDLCGPALTNDGVNTFFAQPGVLNGTALWNFDFAAVGANFNHYTYEVFFDTDPAFGNGTTGSFAIPYLDLVGPQDSENLSFSFFGGSFDPNASGQYEFDLVATPRFAGIPGPETVQMFVNVGNLNVTPEPATMSLLGLGLVSLGGLGVRRRKSRAS